MKNPISEINISIPPDILDTPWVRPLGEILHDTCGLSETHLERALEVQEQKGGRLGEILIRRKVITEADLLGRPGGTVGPAGFHDPAL